jgi:cysteine desulfurase/selenocysteine lyase
MTVPSPIPLDALSGPFDPDAIARIANELFRGAEAASPEPEAAPPPVPWPGLPKSPEAPASAAGSDFTFLDEAAAQVPSTRPEWQLTPSFLELTAHQPEPPALAPQPGPFDALSLRRDFPILEERVHGKPLVWLDNAATTQKPRAVIDRISDFYKHEYSNIHRAAHALAARSTDAYEGAREKARRFLNAGSTREIIFVRGATEAINLVAQSWGRRNVGPGDEIVITWLEHHANIVPWQQLVAEKGAKLRVAPIDDQGQVLLDEYEKLLNPRTRLVSFAQVSNALGTVNPVREMAAMAHRHGAVVLVDGAQSVSHMPVDVQAIGADFFAFSGHKVFGPTGIGVLYGRSDLLDITPPWQGGGNMIADVTFERTVFQPPPARFEAGTGNIADAVGLGAALDYVTRVGLENISRHEHDLLTYATEGLACIPGLRIIGTAREKAGVLSFVLDGFRSEDVGAALDREGIALRSGHHCAQPALRRFGVETSVRPSFALYNTRADIDALVAAVSRLNR